MDGPITLRVLTAEGLAFEAQAASIIAPGAPGYLGILKNHAPLVTTLKPGKLTWRQEGGASKTVHIGSGLLEVIKNHVTILTDSVRESATTERRETG